MRPDGNDDGKVDENDLLKEITYSLYDSGMDADLIKDDLGRKIGAGSNQPVAQNIDTLDFVYLDEEGKPLEFRSSTSAKFGRFRSLVVAKAKAGPRASNRTGGFRTKIEGTSCLELAF